MSSNHKLFNSQSNQKVIRIQRWESAPDSDLPLSVYMSCLCTVIFQRGLASVIRGVNRVILVTKSKVRINLP